MLKDRKIRYDFEHGIALLTAMLKANPAATNQQLVQWSKRSPAFISRYAGTVRERLGIVARPGRKAIRVGIVYCPHGGAWAPLGSGCCTPRFEP